MNCNACAMSDISFRNFLNSPLAKDLLTSTNAWQICHGENKIRRRKKYFREGELKKRLRVFPETNSFSPQLFFNFFQFLKKRCLKKLFVLLHLQKQVWKFVRSLCGNSLVLPVRNVPGLPSARPESPRTSGRDSSHGCG